MTDINVTVTTPSTITATATDPNTVAVAVSAASTVTVSASVGNVGDMTKAVYDTDNDGIVDNSEALGGVAAGSYALSANVPANVSPSVADNFVSFSNTAGAQKDSGKGLTHLVYTLQTSGVAAVNPADGSTYYCGGDNAMTTGANIRRIYFPFTGTIVYASVSILVNTVLGDATQFSCYIRINNTTDVTITSTAQATAAYNFFKNDALSTAVTGGTDYFEGKVVWPTWPTTNPTGVKVLFTVGVRV